MFTAFRVFAGDGVAVLWGRIIYIVVSVRARVIREVIYYLFNLLLYIKKVFASISSLFNVIFL